MVHEGHRSRVKKKFHLHGLDNFENHEVLELLLFFAIPRRDTNETAHKLINEFGSLAAVFDAPCRALANVEGVGQTAATLIKLIPQLSRVYLENKCSPKLKLGKNVKSYKDKLNLKFIGRLEEVTAIILLDAKGKEVYEGIVYRGSVNCCEIYSRKIIELISLYNASAIILGHNHPSGFAMPSKEDLDATAKLNKIFNSMGVTLLDHIISADGDYISMRESGIQDIFD